MTKENNNICCLFSIQLAAQPLYLSPNCSILHMIREIHCYKVIESSLVPEVNLVIPILKHLRLHEVVPKADEFNNFEVPVTIFRMPSPGFFVGQMIFSCGI